MEQFLPTTNEDLRARSKSALILGILSIAASAAVFWIAYILIAIGMFPMLMDWEGDPTALFFGKIAPRFMIALALMGLSASVFGWIAWRKARAVGLEARAREVRRPPMCVIAHILGLSSLIQGLIIIGTALLQLLVFGAFGAILFR